MHAVTNDIHAAVRDYLAAHERPAGLSDQAYAAQVLADLLVLPLLVPDTRYESLRILAEEKAHREAVAHLAEAEAERAATLAALDATVAERQATLDAVTKGASDHE